MFTNLQHYTVSLALKNNNNEARILKIYVDILIVYSNLNFQKFLPTSKSLEI